MGGLLGSPYSAVSIAGEGWCTHSQTPQSNDLGKRAPGVENEGNPHIGLGFPTLFPEHQQTTEVSNETLT